ncbi:unnamed protein product [Dovyalis caffra]|uniref:peptidyl-tRNA hydrolase n=1 Tax=Dovyalis caffra TaxID=77055 RepID=A0AAV1SQQ0_9ROSI|nr:unnamed protein product [Dovyalis caffra]
MGKRIVEEHKLAMVSRVTLDVKGEPQILNLSKKLKVGGIIAHKLWIEQPENIPTCLQAEKINSELWALIITWAYNGVSLARCNIDDEAAQQFGTTFCHPMLNESTTTESEPNSQNEEKKAGNSDDVLVQYVVLRRDLIDTWPMGSVVTQGCHASVLAIWSHKEDPGTLQYCSSENIDSMNEVTLEVKGEPQILILYEELKAGVMVGLDSLADDPVRPSMHRESRYGKLHLYDPLTQKSKTLWTNKTLLYFDSPNYVENLVLVYGSTGHPGTGDDESRTRLLSDGNKKAVVYTLSTDSWKEVEGIAYGRTCYGHGFPVVVQGMCYDLMFRDEKDIQGTIKKSRKVPSILTFDLCNDVFSKMENGLPYDGICDKSIYLMEYKELLAMGVCRNGESTFEFEIWTLTKNQYCWTKLFICRPVPKTRNILPLGFRNDKEIIISDYFSESCHDRLQLYDPLTQQSNMLSTSKDAVYFEAHNYAESLVSVYGVGQ